MRRPDLPLILAVGAVGVALVLFADAPPAPSGETAALGISLLEAPETDLLCGAVAAWYRATYELAEAERFVLGSGEAIAFREPEGTAVLVCEGDEVRLGIAPDEAVATRLAG